MSLSSRLRITDLALSWRSGGSCSALTSVLKLVGRAFRGWGWLSAGSWWKCRVEGFGSGASRAGEAPSAFPSPWLTGIAVGIEICLIKDYNVR